MPHFSEQVDTLERWRRFPGRERLDGAEGIVLTFDDGPDDDSTPAVLEALDRIGARATFFMLGEQLMRHQAIGREVVARGHEVALHGFGHEKHERLTPQQARDDLARGLGAVEAATGRRPRCRQPSSLARTPRTAPAAPAFGVLTPRGR